MPAHAAYDEYYYPKDPENDDIIEIPIAFLTPAARKQVADINDIKARAEKRAEQWKAREQAKYEKEMKEKAERERIRRSQCTIPALWIGCPPKGAK